MSLRGALRRAEIRVEWLDYWGETLLLAQEVKLQELKEKFARAPLHKRQEFARMYPKLAAIMLPPEPPPLPPPLPKPPQPRPVAVAPPPPPPPPSRPEPKPPPVMMSERDVKPVPPPFVHDPPEHMRYRPVRWVPPAERTYDDGDEER